MSVTDTTYPADLVLPAAARRWISAAHETRLKTLLDPVAQSFGIAYALGHRPGQHVAECDLSRRSVEIDTGLATLADAPGFGFFLRDVFRQAVLYAQGNARERVWDLQARYFRKRTPAYFGLMDFRFIR